MYYLLFFFALRWHLSLLHLSCREILLLVARPILVRDTFIAPSSLAEPGGGVSTGGGKAVVSSPLVLIPPSTEVTWKSQTRPRELDRCHYGTTKLYVWFPAEQNRLENRLPRLENRQKSISQKIACIRTCSACARDRAELILGRGHQLWMLESRGGGSIFSLVRQTCIDTIIVS